MSTCVSKVCITLSVGFPLSVFVGRMTIRTLFFRGRDELSTFWHWLITTLWIAASLALAIIIVSSTTVFSVIGSIAGSTFMIILPALMFQREYRNNIVLSIALFCLAVFGVFAGAISITATFL